MKNDWLFGSIKFQNQLQHMVAPVHQKLGTHEFGYIAINHEDELINLHTHIEWLEHCIDKKYYLYDPCMVNPSHIQGGYAFYFTHDEPEFREGLLKESIEIYNMAHEIIYIDHHKDSYEVYSLTAPIEYNQLYNLILNRPELVRNCFNYLKDQMKFIKFHVMDFQINFADIKGERYRTQKGISTL